MEKVDIKPLRSNFNKLIFGGHFYPYNISLWISVSIYNLYYFIQHGYNLYELGLYGLIVLIICGLNEYIFHRYILHKIFYKHHNKHHIYPNKLSIINTPMSLITILIFITYILIDILTNKKIVTISLCVGPIYYVLFEFTHLFSHTYRGSNKIILNVKQYHKLHHIYENNNYGFTTIFWDWLFGTLSPKYIPSFTELLFGFIPFYSFCIHKGSAF